MLLLIATPAPGQDASPEDEKVDSIRSDGTVSATGEIHIEEWVQAKIAALRTEGERDGNAATKAFRSVCRTNYSNPANSGAYGLKLTEKSTAAAVEEFAQTGLSPALEHGLAQMLVDLARQETFDGLVAGLAAKQPIARLLCAKGLADLRSAILTDKNRLDRAIDALRRAGIAETDPVVLRRIYEALAFPPSQGPVFEAYLAILDTRLDQRRAGTVLFDNAENEAVEFFRGRGAASALPNNQQADLVRRLAVFLRLAAERYNAPELLGTTKTPEGDDAAKPVAKAILDERGHIEMLLEAIEGVLTDVVGTNGGNVVRELSGGGHVRRVEVLREALLWVGDADANQAGALNAEPWNVPIGAPNVPVAGP